MHELRLLLLAPRKLASSITIIVWIGSVSIQWKINFPLRINLSQDNFASFFYVISMLQAAIDHWSFCVAFKRFNNTFYSPSSDLLFFPFNPIINQLHVVQFVLISNAYKSKNVIEFLPVKQFLMTLRNNSGILFQNINQNEKQKDCVCTKSLPSILGRNARWIEAKAREVN